MNPKSVGALVASSVGAQALTALSAPLLLRFYSPSEFGHYSICVAIGIVLSVALAGRLELALPIPYSKALASQIYATGQAFIVSASAGALVVISVGAIFHAWSFQTSLFGLAIGVLTAIIQMDVSALNREKQFFNTASLRFVQAALIVFIQTSLAFTADFPNRLETGNVLALAVTAILFRRRRTRFGYTSSIRFHKRVVMSFKRFYLIDIWSALLNSVSNQMPVLLLGKLYSEDVVGHYSLAHRLLTLPVSLVGANLAQVFYQEASSLSRSGLLDHKAFVKPMLMLASLGVITLFPLAIFASPLIRVAFGPGWEMSGDVILIIMPWIFATLVVSPFSGILQFRGQQPLFLLSMIILTVLRLAAFVFAYVQWRSWQYSLISFSAISFAFWIYILFVLMKGKRK